MVGLFVQEVVKTTTTIGLRRERKTDDGLGKKKRNRRVRRLESSEVRERVRRLVRRPALFPSLGRMRCEELHSSRFDATRGRFSTVLLAVYSYVSYILFYPVVSRLL